MFRKIVSNLSFSPALVAQLGFYAKRLRKEQVTRRVGLIFTALALVVQSLVVFQPPESANASNNADFIPGGLGTGSSVSLNKFLGPYDRNERHLKDVFNYFGITREEITQTKLAQFRIGTKITYGFENRAGSKAIAITDSSFKQVTTIYGRPLTAAGNSPDGLTYAYIGHSTKIGWFAILQVCGNLITDKYPEKPTPPAPAKVVADKKAVNVTQGDVDATKSAAKANDQVKYTVSVKNTGGTATNVNLKDNLTDVLGFSRLIDNGGGTFEPASNTLSWGSVSLGPSQTVTKNYTVQLNDSLVTEKTDCEMNNMFIDQVVTVPVGCTTPPAKIEVNKTAVNVSQGNVNATTVTAKEDDRITFTLTVKNTGGTAKEFTFVDDLGDVLEYATLTDRGGAEYNEDTRQLTWPAITLEPGDTQTRVFSIKVLSDIPATPTGVSDPSSYDCRMENTFYDSYVVIPVTCAPPKVIEQVTTELPTTGPGENIAFSAILLAVVTFFFFRSKQLGREVRLIRRDVNTGAF